MAQMKINALPPTAAFLVSFDAQMAVIVSTPVVDVTAGETAEMAQMKVDAAARIRALAFLANSDAQMAAGVSTFAKDVMVGAIAEITQTRAAAAVPIPENVFSASSVA